MRVVYFLIDLSLDSDYRKLNSFLSYFYSCVVRDVIQSLPTGLKVKYKFLFYNETVTEIISEFTIPDDYNHIGQIVLHENNFGGKASVGKAFQKVIDDFFNNENSVGVLPTIFMLVNYNTNTLAPRFEDVFNKFLNSSGQGYDKLQKASRIIVNISYYNDNNIFKLDNIRLLGQLEEPVRYNCSQTPFYNYNVFPLYNKGLTQIIKFLSIPSEINTYPDWEDFSPAIQQADLSTSNEVHRMENAEETSVDTHKDEQKVSESDASPKCDKNDDTIIQGSEPCEDVAPTQEMFCDDTEIDEADISKIETDIYIEKMGYDQRIILALQVCDFLNENGKSIFTQIKKRGFYKNLPFMKWFKYKHIPSFVSNSDSYLLAYLIFYIISGGKYPQDVWQDVFADYDKTSMGKFEGMIANMRNTIEDFCGRRIASEFEKKFDDILYEQKRAHIQAAMGNLNGVGCAKIFELIWFIFTKKFEYYDIDFWEKTLQEFHGKKFLVREAPRKETCNLTQLFAVSYEGRLDKPGHNGCEDYSLIKKYDENNWLVVVADGVGSCINSALGSKEAALCLSNCIEQFLISHKLITNKKGVFGNKRFSDNEYADLMYYVKFLLAKDFYKKWEEAIQESQDFKRAKDANMGEFATTLQFAFGCAKFIACGALGDGSFYVKKRIITDKDESGGFILNDGISGVLRHEVLTVPHLKNNPNALQFSFFDYKDVSDIFISSDGVTNAVGETVKSVDTYIQSVSALSFDARCQVLDQLAQKCSDFNETNFGSGDDSSIAYVHIN